MALKSSNYTLGYTAEVAIAKKIDKAIPAHNIIRFGGIERYKRTFMGDVGCLWRDKDGWQCEEAEEYGDCSFQQFYIDVKRWKNKQVPSWWRKLLDDMEATTAHKAVLIWWKAHGDWRVRVGGRVIHRDITLQEWLDELE